MTPPLPLLPLAQSTAPLSHEMLGMIVIGLMLMSRWLWDYNRQRREEAAQIEPKSNPPLHERFISRPEYGADQEVLDARLNAATESRRGIHKEIELHGHRLTSLEKGEKHTEATLANIDRKLETLLKRTFSRPANTDEA